MAARQLVVVVAQDQRRCRPAAGAQQGAHQLARARVAVLEILDDQHHLAGAGQTLEGAEQALAYSCAALVGRLEGGRVERDAQSAQAISDGGHDRGHVMRGGSEHRREALVGQVRQRSLERCADRRVRNAAARCVTSTAAEQDIGSPGQAPLDLVDQAGHADADWSGDSDARRLATGGALKSSPNDGQLAFTTDERHGRSITAVWWILDTCGTVRRSWSRTAWCIATTP